MAIARWPFATFLSVLLVRVAATAVRDDLARMNGQLTKINSIAAHLAWREALEPSDDLRRKKLRLVETNESWRESWCEKLRDHYRSGLFAGFELRQFYLLCRGPKYTGEQVRELTETVEQLRGLYRTRKVCRKDGTCLSGEPDLERLMTTSRDPEELLWGWIEWRNAVGEPSRGVYSKMVDLLNVGARNNGYHDIGECWREELEVRNLESLVRELYAEVEPLYAALHAVVRHRLSRYYGKDLVSLDEAIPAHLLGNLWGHSWSSLIDLIAGDFPQPDITAGLKRKNYTVEDLANRAEDFYLSLGFAPMTDDFWKNSKLVKTDVNRSACHPSAVNMFAEGDFRMLLCAEVTAEDFKVIHHEMGHIQYYMEYQDQPAIFQEGANSAFQEAVGDAIAYGVTTPAHLQRLGLIPEVDAGARTGVTPDADLRLLLEQALFKLPQIPFALALEEWRWGVFRGDIRPADYNQAWWRLTERYQGVKAPVPRGEEFFDAAAKFHVNDNTPYVRYFLSGFLEVQLFEALCKGAIYGYEGRNRSLPVPLHRCDIYGAKEGAEPLREMMSLGRSIDWSAALEIVTGQRRYSSRPLLDYYQPLREWLAEEIARSDIPVGW